MSSPNRCVNVLVRKSKGSLSSLRQSSVMTMAAEIPSSLKCLVYLHNCLELFGRRANEARPLGHKPAGLVALDEQPQRLQPMTKGPATVAQASHPIRETLAELLNVHCRCDTRPTSEEGLQTSASLTCKAGGASRTCANAYAYART